MLTLEQVQAKARNASTATRTLTVKEETDNDPEGYGGTLLLEISSGQSSAQVVGIDFDDSDLLDPHKRASNLTYDEALCLMWAALEFFLKLKERNGDDGAAG